MGGRSALRPLLRAGARGAVVIQAARWRAAGVGTCDDRPDLDGILAGAIRYWPVLVGAHPTLLLGPVAVHPTRQGEGLGALLIEESLAAATGWDRVILVGDAPYYGRFGFEKLDGVIMPPPTNPDRVLGRALRPGAWDGIAGEVRKAG